jgi:hypothetical protein
MTPDSDLQIASRVADARLGVAEDFRWPLAALTGVATQLILESPLVTIPITIAVFVLATTPYRRAAAKAEDEYFKAAALGKHYSPAAQPKDDPTR